MDQQLSVVATGFRVIGLALGIPSLVALICLAGAWISLHSGVPAGDTTTTVANSGLVGLLVGGARVLGKLFGAFAALTSWAIVIMAIVALALAILGVALFFTGRGLHAHAAWARVVGMLLSFCLLAISGVVLLSLRRVAIIAALPVGLSIYSLWVLIRRFQ